MASYPTEEEQIEALKRWWKENGNSLLIGVAIALVALFGSRQWQSSRQAEAEAASDTYDSIVQQVALADDTAALTTDSMAALESAYDVLRNDFPKSIYTRYAALVLAGVYVNQENYDQAEAELSWVLDNPDLGFMKSAEPELYLTARLRLARVKLAKGEAQQAIDLLTAVEPGTLAAGYAEVEGDAYAQLGQNELARSAYQRALDLQPDNLGFIQLKLRGLSG